jgi:hypothetical protein
MRDEAGGLTGPGIMLLSALIFAFFGFVIGWITQDANGRTLLFMVLWVWTLRISAVVFAASAVITFIKPVIGNLLYALTGVVGAGLFVVIAVMDIADTEHTVMAYGPVILVLFAVWNGYGSWSALRGVLAGRGRAAVGDARSEP